MENKDSKMIAIIALVIGVIGLSIGFAAFTQTLEIKNTTAEVKPVNSLNVHFPTSGTISPVGSDENATGSDITLNSGTLITGLKASFKEPGQYVTYTTTIYNDASYTAYLRAVTFSKNGVASCASSTAEGSNPASAGTVAAACANMKMYVTIGNTGSELVKNVTTNQTNISGKTIAAGAHVPVTVKLSYEGTSVPDGDFDVDFGNIQFDFSSEDYVTSD